MKVVSRRCLALTQKLYISSHGTAHRDTGDEAEEDWFQIQPASTDVKAVDLDMLQVDSVLLSNRLSVKSSGQPS